MFLSDCFHIAGMHVNWYGWEDIIEVRLAQSDYGWPQIEIRSSVVENFIKQYVPWSKHDLRNFILKINMNLLFYYLPPAP